MSYSEHIVGICKNHHLNEVHVDDNHPLTSNICEYCDEEVKWIHWVDCNYNGMYKKLNMKPFLIGTDFEGYFLYRIPSPKEIELAEEWRLNGQYVSKSTYDREHTDYDNYLEDPIAFFEVDPETFFCVENCHRECENCPYDENESQIEMCPQCGKRILFLISCQ